MSAATMQSTPAIPPRPARSQDNASTTATSGSTPSIPPRPNRFRSVSPNPDRFAPSPLNEGFNPPKSNRLSASFTPSSLGTTTQSTTDLDRMGPGEEGAEYAAASYDNTEDQGKDLTRQVSPEQTRTVGEDIKLHAPKPTVPAQSAKERVAQVTRTDSDRAASFGIGRPSSTEQQNPPRTLRKKASTASQLSQSSHLDDDGIPEIGIQVPMYPHAGDVQAPSPAPGAITPGTGTPGQRNHHRKRSSRGFTELPPGSYGLHGHGVAPSDKLEKAYYEKHPELHKKEHYKYLQERPTDFSMSSDDLNKIVRGGGGTDPYENYTSTPSEQVGYQAAEEYTSRLSRPPSAAPRDIGSPAQASLGGTTPNAEDDEVIHVHDRGHHRGVLKYGDDQSAPEGNEQGYEAPILASDEVAKRSSQYELYPAVDPPSERRGSAYEMERPRSITGSRPSSIYSPTPQEAHSTALDDVEEYEPLFPEDDQGNKIPLSAAQLQKIRQRFPSRDIWEDAPDSVHGTAEVSTPDVLESATKRLSSSLAPREGETAAQAFARQQEELAEKESMTADSFLWRTQRGSYSEKSTPKEPTRPGLWNDQQGKSRRFPSRDVWEDTPDSLQFTTTVSGPQADRDAEEEEPATQDTAAANKPAVPPRPKKTGSGDLITKPMLPERPKPQLPARPAARQGSDSADASEQAAKAKPAVPARPVGGKIAALQAGFMSDLNKRLQLGPQAPKKEEPVTEDLTEEKEKVPLADARKGRARGPQRRAPTKSAVGSGDKSTPPPANSGKPVLSFSITHTLWSIDEEGTMVINPEEADEPQTTVQEVEPESVPESEPKAAAAPSTKEVHAQEPASSTGPTEPETKTLATNTAGESILQESVTKSAVGDEVKKVEGAKDDVIES